jgi:hypothetical protein
MLSQKNKKSEKNDICKNMKRKTRKGGIAVEIITIEDDEPTKKCNCPICKKKKKEMTTLKKYLTKKRKTRKRKF